MSYLDTLNMMVQPDMITAIYQIQQKVKEHLTLDTCSYSCAVICTSTVECEKKSFVLLIRTNDTKTTSQICKDLTVLLNKMIKESSSKFVKENLSISVT